MNVDTNIIAKFLDVDLKTTTLKFKSVGNDCYRVNLYKHVEVEDSVIGKNILYKSYYLSAQKGYLENKTI